MTADSDWLLQRFKITVTQLQANFKIQDCIRFRIDIHIYVIHSRWEPYSDVVNYNEAR